LQVRSPMGMNSGGFCRIYSWVAMGTARSVGNIECRTQLPD